jgi:DNA repair ATPase RecN
MLKKIKLKNFMSHKNSEIELCRGVNVLTGPNNSGKSAVVTALELLTQLPTREGVYMIRHGESEASVSIETEEGDTVTWGRKEGSSSLQINGERHTRISNNHDYFLNELHKVLKLPQVKNKDESFDIHIANQKQPIFLLNEPPSRAATFFSVSSDAGRLVEVRDLFKTRVNKSKERKNSLERKKLSLNEELLKLAPLKEIEESIENLKARFTNLNKEELAIKDGLEFLESLKKSHSEFIRLEKKFSILEKLNQQNELISLAEIGSSITEIKALEEKSKKLEFKVSGLLSLKLPPQTIETSDIEIHLSQVKLLENQIKQFFNFSAALDILKEPSIEIDTSLLEFESAKLLELLREEKRKNKLHDVYDLIIEPPELEPFELLEGSIREYSEVLRLVNILEEKTLIAKNDLEKWILENPTCPTCGNPLDSKHLMGDINHG